MATVALVVACVVQVLVTCLLLLWMTQVAMPHTFYAPSAPKTPSHPVTSAHGDRTGWAAYPIIPSWSDFLTQSNSAQVPSWLQFASSAKEADAINQHALLRLALFHLALGVITYVVTHHVIVPPYGRHAVLSPLHVTLPARAAWMLQECPTLLNVAYYLLIEHPAHMAATVSGTTRAASPSSHSFPLVWSELSGYTTRVWNGVQHCHLGLALFTIHYIHRSLLYPLAISKQANAVPVHVVWCATVYCLFNGRLQLLANLRLFSAFQSGDSDAGTSFQYVRCFLQGEAICDLENAAHGSSAVATSATVTRLLLFTSTGLCGALFLAGSFLFFFGLRVNINADYTLLSLRDRRAADNTAVDALQDTTAAPALQPAASRYTIPRGGLFERVCCPNFLGELLEWFGYALVVISLTMFPYASTCFCSTASLALTRLFTVDRVASGLAALSFALYVVANLVPRAFAHHDWYARTFGKAYTSLNRKAVIPGIF